MKNSPEIFPDFDIVWLKPYEAIQDEDDCLEFGRIHNEVFDPDVPPELIVADTLVDELLREMAPGHCLEGMSFKAVASCAVDPNNFVFLTNDPEYPIALVHLTWLAEEHPGYPACQLYDSLEEWNTQMEEQHSAWLDHEAERKKSNQ